MSRQFLVFTTVISTLAVAACAADAQEATPKKVALPKSNQVYVKIIMPNDPANLRKDQPVVESWIVNGLKMRGQAKFTAVTGWVRLDPSPFGATDVWDGVLGDISHCPVGADIPHRAKGRIKILLAGWSPGGATVTASLTDEPGSRVIAAVEQYKDAYKNLKGMPYVAVLIGPPPEPPAAPTDRAIADER